jgi:hypothetical protein
MTILHDGYWVALLFYRVVQPRQNTQRSKDLQAKSAFWLNLALRNRWRQGGKGRGPGNGLKQAVYEQAGGGTSCTDGERCTPFVTAENGQALGKLGARTSQSAGKGARRNILEFLENLLRQLLTFGIIPVR